MERSSFFNSINHDRRYKAEDWAEYFKSFIGNGVFPNPSTSLQVIASSDMAIQVMAGKAWINGYFYLNTDNLNIKLDNADGQLNRIDRIIVCWDLSERKMSVKVKPSVYSADPTPAQLQRDATKYEIALADVYVGRGTTDIRQNNITDLRLNSELCGVVTGVVKQIDTTDIYNRVNAEIEKVKGDLSKYKQDEKALFDSWFASIQNILSGDVAANLATQIQANTTKIETNIGAIQENKTNIQQIKNWVDGVSGGIQKYKTVVLGNCVYDNENLYIVKINADSKKGYVLWIDGEHTVYAVKRIGAEIVIYSTGDISKKTINVLETIYSDSTAFIGLKEKTTSIIILTNEGNKGNLTDWTYAGASVTYKADRAEARTNGSSRNIVATKPIDLSRYSRIRLYGNLISDYTSENLAVRFGVLKKEVISNPTGYNPNASFLASKRIMGLKDGEYIEVDINQINGQYNIGTYGIGSYDTYKFELLK